MCCSTSGHAKAGHQRFDCHPVRRVLHSDSSRMVPWEENDACLFTNVVM